MTIERLLELRTSMMGDAHEAVAVLQKSWEEQDKPAETEGLIRVLKMTLDRCVRSEVVYPRIFLRRLGELRRGEFQPQKELKSVIDPASMKFTVPTHPKIPAEWIEQALQRDGFVNSRRCSENVERAIACSRAGPVRT
jgi:hypothetical protein